ncbi:MAG: helix-turn-helix domain-containing protein [Conexivisphaerales archaeon]|jgi:sugar-specific transcriptional regulator TrmB
MSTTAMRSEAEEPILSLMKETGFTKEAARAFLAVLGKQSATAADICREAGIFDSKVYRALDELESRQLILKQPGNPNRYATPAPRDVLKALSDDITAEHARKLALARRMVERIKPLYEAAAPDPEFELAYIVRGRKAIVRAMEELIGDSKNELVVLLAEPTLVSDVEEALRKASDCGVEVRLALGRRASSRGLASLEPRTLDCDCNIIVGDGVTMLSTDAINGEVTHAIVTSDDGMIRMAQGYYEGPGCCVS